MNIWNLIMLKLRESFNNHKDDSNAHHIRYTDSEAVTAVLEDDSYVKNTGDEMDGEMIINQSNDLHGVLIRGYDDQSNTEFKISIGSSGDIWIQNNKTDSIIHFNKEILAVEGVDLYNHAIKRPLSYVDASLSGTPRLIKVLLGTTPYYFKVYPTMS